MEELNTTNTTGCKPWKKVLSVLLSIIIAFGTFVTITFGNSRFQKWLGIRDMLSAYAAEMVDTKGAIAVDEEAMLANDHTINLENKDGSNTVYLFSEPISYTDENGKLKTKDISVEKQTDKKLKSNGYEYTNGQNDYRIHFSTDSSTGLYIEFDNSSYSIIPQSDNSAEGAESTSEILGERFEDFEYKNIYGEGTNLKFYPQLNGVKDEIVLNSNIGKNIFSFKLTTSNCKAVLNDDGTVSLISNDNGESVQTFAAPFAYDSKYIEGDKNEHYIDCSYSLKEVDDNTYIISVNVDKSWLESENTTFPITIDPVTANIGNYRDTGVYSATACRDVCYGKEATCCLGKSQEYGRGQVYNMFTMPDSIKKGAKINSAYNWQRETTGRTSNFYVTPYLVKGAWEEGKLTWNLRPGYHANVAMTRRNINSKSTDDSSNAYWYKFNIAKAVQMWANGTSKNYGIVFISEEESKDVYNWRAFASKQYGTSAMRPYTVINYTNDTTKPTIGGITKSPAGWTNQNVTFTVAASDSGSGLASSAYSFSNASGSYSWGTAKSKTYSTNQTVYFGVRDNAGNIATTSRNTYIDKLAPSIPTYSGYNGNWTNKDVTVTVKSTDRAANSSYGCSGVKSYSSSNTQGSYSWKDASAVNASYNFTYTSNGTYYIYAKDQAGNISSDSTAASPASKPLVLKVKIDKAKPVISDVSVTKDTETKKTTVTITATDALSGIAGYSFDGGNTYQSENSKTFDNVPNSVSIAVKDNAGNIATQVTEAILPEFYEDGNLVGILNPNTDSNEKLQYKIGEDGEWTDYTVPFAVPLGEESTVYAKVGNSESVVSKTVKPDTSTIGAYTESNTDFSLTYKGVSFDFTRSYDSSDKKWFFATDSNVTVKNDYVLSAVLPDGTDLTFVKTGDNTYVNESNNYTLTKSEDGYIIQIDGINYTYDIDGKLVSVSNKYDDKINIARSESAITVSDGANRKYVLALDSAGNIVSVTDPAGNAINYTYSDNNLTKVVDQAGVTLGQYSYTNGVLTKSMDKTINYSNGRISSIVYDSGAYLNYSYDDENKTISTESSVETTTSQTYNDALMTVSSTDEEGKTAEYTYDKYYRTLTETSDGKTVTYTYDAKGNVLSEVSDDEDAENTYYKYDTNGNVIRQQTGKNYTYSVYNDNNELVISASLKENYKGDIPSQYNADLDCFDTVTYTYENGLLVKSVDGKSNETVTYLYDDYGNTTKTTTLTETDNESKIGTVDSTYDLFGNVLTTKSGDETSSYIYDKAGRTLLANEKGDCTRTIYDDLGRTVQEIGSEDYDSSKDGLPTENTYSDANAGHTYKYAANGTLTSETNRLGKTTKYFYNDIGSKVREEFDIYKFYYLNHGELYQVKVANVTTVTYSYDKDFHLLSESYANDDVIRYTYNDNGDVTAQYHNSNAKPYVTYTYNDDGELTEKVNADTKLKYVYGENDKVEVYKTSDNALVQSYTETKTDADEENGIESKTDVTESHFGTSYSSVVKDKSIEYTNASNTVLYSYTTTGTDDSEKINASSVKYNGSTSLSSSYSYDDNGNVLAKSYGENTSITNTYDSKDRITSTTYAGKTTNYTYDSNGQLLSANDDTYAYDSRGNITSKTESGTTTTFTYSTGGWKDQLVSVNGVDLTYDDNGNVLTYGDKKYTWNSGRNLESIVDGDKKYSYTYDENGIRTSKTVNGVTTYFNTKDGVILSQTDGTNTWYFQYDTNGSPLGFVLNGTQYFYITNQMGDVLAITDTNGSIVGNYKYDAWGKVLTADTDIAKQNPIRYRGYYYDNETDYYYLQSRYYDSNICRFINADIPEIAQMSKGISAGTNLFAYCNNDAVNNSDPTGHFGTPIQWVCAIIGALLGLPFGKWLANKLGYYSGAKYIAIRAAAVVGGAALGWFAGKLLIKLVSYYIEHNPAIMIKLVQKFGADTAVKIMNFFGTNFLKRMSVGTLVNLAKNLSSPTRKLPLKFVQYLYQACKSLGLKVTVDSGHKGTAWNSYHMHIGNARIHLALSQSAYAWLIKILGKK